MTANPHATPTPSPIATQETASREALVAVVLAAWTLLDGAEELADGGVRAGPHSAAWLSEALDKLNALVPDNEQPFGGGFAAGYLWDHALSSSSKRIEELERERDEAIRERTDAEVASSKWFGTHLSHRTALDALGAANGELFKRAYEAEHRAEAAKARADSLAAELAQMRADAEHVARSVVTGTALMAEENLDRQDLKQQVRSLAAIRAAFPELFDGTGWIAPWEATEEMTNAGCRSAVDDLEPTNPEMEIFYRAMRDAHLASSAKSGEA